ncbi:hypothetical protein K2V56_02545 [Staphylococcus chromogenes]|uniref:DUF6731 family protein n=1 Tax=Staphylococcus chromogenes TaxID=46126 RepID=UPI001E4E7BEA|nr:DUF6731 family protein [Staphylococcus chromogenes]MCD8904343.1 hypothetical protein [Staphylococcus chromogenes]
MSKQKIVNFNVFYTCSIQEKGKAPYVSLTELFETIRKEYEEYPQYKVVKNYNYDPVRIKKIEPPNKNGYYHIVVERLDDTRYQKTTIYGDSIDLELENDEYIGHEISILYDPAKNVMVIQRNFSSLSPSGIEKFIDSILFDYYEKYFSFSLIPAMDNNAFKRARNSKTYKQLTLKVKGQQRDDLLKGLVYGSYDGVETVEIVITANRSKNGELNKTITTSLLDDWHNEEETEKLKVKIIENDDSNVETVDLLRQTIKRSLKYEYREAGELNANSIFLDMVRIYSEDDDAISLIV